LNILHFLNKFIVFKKKCLGLAGRRFVPSPELVNGTGPGIQEKLYEMNTLWTKYKTNQNQFTEQDKTSLLEGVHIDFLFLT
jgi:hypothetical protein